MPASFPIGTANVVVGGTTAENVDFFDITNNQYLPIVFAFVLGLSFLLLSGRSS